MMLPKTLLHSDESNTEANTATWRHGSGDYFQVCTNQTIQAQASILPVGQMKIIPEGYQMEMLLDEARPCVVLRVRLNLFH